MVKAKEGADQRIKSGAEEVEKGLFVIEGQLQDDYHNQKDRCSNSMMKMMEESKYDFHLWLNGMAPKKDNSKFSAGQYLHYRMAKEFDQHFLPEMNFIIRESIDGRTAAGKAQKKAYEQLCDSIENGCETYVLSYNDAVLIDGLVERAKALPYFDKEKYEIVGVELVGYPDLKILTPNGQHEETLEQDYYDGEPISADDIHNYSAGVDTFLLRGAADLVVKRKSDGVRIIVDWKLTGVFDDWVYHFRKMKYARAGVIYKYAFNASECHFVVFNRSNGHEIMTYEMSQETHKQGLSMLRKGARDMLYFYGTYNPDELTVRKI